MTGGRYEESNFAATGSGSLHASTVIKLGFREGLARGEAVDLAISALYLVLTLALSLLAKRLEAPAEQRGR